MKVFRAAIVLIFCLVLSILSRATVALGQAPATRDPIQSAYESLRVRCGHLGAAQVKAIADEEAEPFAKLVWGYLAEEKRKAEGAQQAFEADVKREYQSLAKDYGAARFDAILRSAREAEAKREDRMPARVGAMYLLAVSAAIREANIQEANSALQRLDFIPIRKLQLLLNMIPADNPAIAAIPIARRLEFAAALLERTRVALAVDDFDTGQKMLDLATRYLELQPRDFAGEDRVAALAHFQVLKLRLAAQRQQLAENQQQFAKYQAGRDEAGRLKDGAAAYEAALYRLCRDGSETWPSVLALLAHSDRQPVAAAASAELELRGEEPTPKQSLALAEQWLAATEFEKNSPVLARRAAAWYRHAATGTSGELTGKRFAALHDKLQALGAIAKRDVLPLNEWTDLVTGVDPTKDARHGTWQVKNGLLRSGRDGKPSKIALPYLVHKTYNYDLEVSFQHSAGDDPSIILRFPVSDKYANAIVVDTFLNGTSGLDTFEGAALSDSATKFRYDLEPNKPYVLTISVREAGEDRVRIRAEIDGKQVLDGEGRRDLMYLRGSSPTLPNDFVLSNWNIASQFGVRIRPVDAQVERLPR
jgi:hypothetical protein